MVVALSRALPFQRSADVRMPFGTASFPTTSCRNKTRHPAVRRSFCFGSFWRGHGFRGGLQTAGRGGFQRLAFSRLAARAAAHRHPVSPAQDIINRVIIAAVWPESYATNVEGKSEELEAYYQMARPINLLPSVLLVFLGAWLGADRSVEIFRMAKVWVMAFISAAIAVASVVVNDYFDYISGVDVVNSPDKPLPRGVVPPDGALLFSSGLYIAVLVVGCLLDPPLLRVIIAASAAVTLLYTPFLKRITAVKNAVCASVIASSPVAGALAAGMATDALPSVLPPCAAAFLGILYRETLMDISDVEGDRAAGVRTLPVVLGPRVAFLLALLQAGVAAALALWSIAHGRMAASVQALLGSWASPWAFSAVVVLLVFSPLISAALAVPRQDFQPSALKHAIDSSLLPIGLCMISIAALL